MVLFIVKCNENNIEILMNQEENILDLKNKIIKTLNLKCTCIDLFIKTNIPIRGMGKYTLENGIISRTMDYYKMNKFNLENKNIHLEIIELKDNYNTQIKKNFGLPNKKYVIPKLRVQQINPKLNINDINEFPSLS